MPLLCSLFCSAFSLLSLATISASNAVGNVLLKAKRNRSFAFSSSRSQLSCTLKVTSTLLNALQVSLPFPLVTVPLVALTSPFSVPGASCSRITGEGTYVPSTFYALSSFKFTHTLLLGNYYFQLLFLAIATLLPCSRSPSLFEAQFFGLV